MEPLLRELLTIEIHCPDVGESIVAAREDAAWAMVGTIEVCHGCQIAFTAIAIAAFVVLSIGAPIE